MKSLANDVANAIRDTLTSPNVADSNLENANVVDALDRIASGLFAVAKAIREAGQPRAQVAPSASEFPDPIPASQLRGGAA